MICRCNPNLYIRQKGEIHNCFRAIKRMYSLFYADSLLFKQTFCRKTDEKEVEEKVG